MRQQPDTLTVRESALKLDCTLKYIFDLLYAGKLPGATKVGRQWRIPKSSVEERLKQRQQVGAAV